MIPLATRGAIILALTGVVLLAACTRPSTRGRSADADRYSDPSEAIHRPPTRPNLWRTTMSSETFEGVSRLDVQALSLVVPVDDSRNVYAYIVVNGHAAPIEYHWEKLVTPEAPDGVRGKVDAHESRLVHSEVAGADHVLVQSPFRGGFSGNEWGMQVTTPVPGAR